MLLSEHYLNQPIGEFLLHHHSGELDAETDHPNLNQASRRGRPRQIDFCLLSRETLRITAAIELKWVSDGVFDKQRVVDDLLRLEVLSIPQGQHVYRYFLIAGIEKDFKAKFRLTQANLGGGGRRVAFFPELFDFDTDAMKTIVVSDLSAPQRTLCDEFASYYQSPLPRRFITQRIFAQSLNGFTVFIWRIRSVKGRRTIPLPEGV